MIKVRADRYEGIIVDNTTLPASEEEFRSEIENLIDASEGKKLLWIKMSIEQSAFIPILAKLDFEFHHCDERNLMLVRKLTPNAIVPTTKNYIVGVGAIVVHDQKLLVVKDRFSVGYKLPGGHVDKNESLKDAVKREVYEETGIEIDFESIVNLGHFQNGQFGESNLYIVCTAKPLSCDITINDSSEIAEARWIHFEDFLSSDDVNNYNKSVVKAALNNRELKLTDRPVKLRISGGEVFF